MILRRFIQHVKEQNWFAVGLDVIVVIVGIFLGLQVQAWYEDQKTQAQERAYLLRLNNELENVLVSSDSQRARNTSFNETAHEVVAAITGNAEPTLLNEPHCRIISLIHIYIQNSNIHTTHI